MLRPLLFLVLGLGAASSVSAAVPVTTIGTLRDVMMNDDRVAKVTLADLPLPHLVAVGPLENLDGEITVLDGQPSISRLNAKGDATMDHSTASRAVTLVFANVAEWGANPLGAPVRSLAALDAAVENAAKDAGLDPESAFPFTIRGKLGRVSYHVLRGTDEHGLPVRGGDPVAFTAEPAEGTLVGFFSKHHQGIFTHKGSFTHVHYVSEDGQRSGHVDGVSFAAGAVQIAFPR